MQQEELKGVFDRQASGYDRQWAGMAPVRDGLHFLLPAIFSALPADARILCVGAGTGAEIAYLACRFPEWTFTAVDPSEAMLEVCRERARLEGYLSRCDFHAGYLDSLTAGRQYDGATCFLVSQFILQQDARVAFFRQIADRLKPGGLLASSDLASDIESIHYDTLLRAWLTTMGGVGVQAEALERMRTAYANDVAVLPPQRVASMIEAGGFTSAVQFYQAGLIHAWVSMRALDDSG